MTFTIESTYSVHSSVQLLLYIYIQFNIIRYKKDAKDGCKVEYNMTFITEITQLLRSIKGIIQGLYIPLQRLEHFVSKNLLNSTMTKSHCSMWQHFLTIMFYFTCHRVKGDIGCSAHFNPQCVFVGCPFCLISLLLLFFVCVFFDRI